MRRVLIAVAILVLPTVVALTLYILVNKKIPTNPAAVGKVETIAGDGSSHLTDQTARNASFNDPFGIAVDRKGNVFISDGGESNRIRRLNSNGIVESIAGSGEGFADGPARRAKFNTPSGIAINKRGELIIADTSNNKIRVIDVDGQVRTLAGRGDAGLADGASTEAQFDGPVGVAVDDAGNVYVADTYNDCIRKVTPDGRVTTMAGGGQPGFADGEGAIARFDTPSGLAVDDQGTLYVADTGNSSVRKITPAGEVTTLANGQGETPRNSRRSLRHPIGIAVTHDRFLFVTCEDGVFRIDPRGELELYAGGKTGYADGTSDAARFNGASGVAVDRQGNLFIADTNNHVVRMVVPVAQSSEQASAPNSVQSARAMEAEQPVVPRITPSELANGSSFPWPLLPQNQWHEITGVMGEARGAPGGIALDHLHSGLDVRGAMGEPVVSVYDEKVSSPRPAWDFGGTNEGVSVGLFTYIHVQVGRRSKDDLDSSGRFKAVRDSGGALTGVRVRRGTRFRTGDFVGTVNSLYHVHLNLGPWSAQVNPIQLPFAGFKDTTPPVVERDGIEIIGPDQMRLTEKRAGRLLVSGDVSIQVTAYDQVDGGKSSRKLSLYRLRLELLTADGTPLDVFGPGFNIEFNRMPPDDPMVSLVYAPGSGVSAYGTPTKFKYIATNSMRDGEASAGLFRSSKVPPGDYTIRVIAEDYSGNRATGPTTELPITIERP